MDEQPKFYLYKMTSDDGAAPCVQSGLLSLAICKPVIRRTAREGDVIIGFAGDGLEGKGYLNNCIIYVAVVSKKLEGGSYYTHPRYAKRPDCIYRRVGREFRRKMKAAFHAAPGDLIHDLGIPPSYAEANVLLSESPKEFRYFGNQSPFNFKNDFSLLKLEIESLTQGHRVQHCPGLYAELLELKKRVWTFQSSVESSPVPLEPRDDCDSYDETMTECGYSC